MIIVECFVNQLMSSNCFVVIDDEAKRCVCIDPASEKSDREIKLIEDSGLKLDFILLTHEHTDHTWGVNALLEKYPSAKVICSERCKEALPREAKAYFQFYYDDPNYTYNVMRVDFTTEELSNMINWEGNIIYFVDTPGHSPGSVCIVIDNMIFGGDTLMPFRPFIKKRNGGSIEKYKESVEKMLSSYSEDTIVYPGHGDIKNLKDYKFLCNSF